MTRIATALVAALVSAAATHTVPAQAIARRIGAVRDGVVLLSFAARPGVCGNGAGSIWTAGARSGSSDRQSFCVPGPVRVSLGRADNATISVRVIVGGQWRANSSETDLGMVSAAEAAEYLIGVAHVIG